MVKGLGSTLSLAAIFWFIAATCVQAQAPAPVFKQGDTWHYKYAPTGGIRSSTDTLDGVYEITFTQGGFKLYEVEGGSGRGGEIPVQIGTGDRSERLLSGFGQVEKRQVLSFPLSVGQKWNYEYTTSPPGFSSNQTRSVEVNVVGMEDVTTPAGTFKAYKVVRVETYAPRPRARNLVRATATYFYSPETRSIVKGALTRDTSDATQDYELIKFTPGS